MDSGTLLCIENVPQALELATRLWNRKVLASSSHLTATMQYKCWKNRLWLQLY
jgi:hypothetical protein